MNIRRCRLNGHIQKDATLIICTNNGILSVIVIDLAAAEADVCFQTVLHQLLLSRGFSDDANSQLPT